MLAPRDHLTFSGSCVSEIVAIHTYRSLVDKVDEVLEENEIPEISAELKDINRMSELRGQAMEIFTHLPSQEVL